MARSRVQKGDRFPHLLSDHRSPLRRFSHEADPLQLGKERNVALAARRIDGILIPPNGVFSYHHVVGRPSRLRGFHEGLELRDLRLDRGVGGGCCQVSNLLYWLALAGGMRIVERHRHGLDLFPDQGRSVPFGCGATVFYSYRDLRFENPLSQPVALSLKVEDGELVGRLLAHGPVPFRVEIYESKHRFYREGGEWMRENRIRRRFTLDDGALLFDQEVAHNVARVLYRPSGVEMTPACGAGGPSAQPAGGRGAAGRAPTNSAQNVSREAV